MNKFQLSGHVSGIEINLSLMENKIHVCKILETLKAIGPPTNPKYKYMCIYGGNIMLGEKILYGFILYETN